MFYCQKDSESRKLDKEWLDKIVDDICATYDDEKGINHIEGANLPSQKKVLEIVNLLLEIIFPGFSGNRYFSYSNIRYNIGEITALVFDKLCDQISKAYRFNCKLNKCDSCDVPQLTEKAAKNLISQIPEIRNNMKLDVNAAFDGDPAAKSLDEIILSYPCIQTITIQRIGHILYSDKVPLLPRMISEYAHSITGIDIHPGAKLGSSLFIDHGTGVVIGETATIGNNVKIYQGVTLGALSFPKDERGNIIKGIKRHPTIEDNVVIYAGATILGNITIGKDSVIGGNVWITEDVPPGTKITLMPPKHSIKNKNKNK